jgi:ArsR family transcriptional regulator
MRGADAEDQGCYICIMTQTRKRTGPVKRRPPATPRLALSRKAPIDGALDAELFRALSDETRLSLVACIAKCGRACSVGEVALCCSVDVSVVSRHLALLARAGVLSVRRRGRVVAYALQYDELCESLRALASAIESLRPADNLSKGACNDGCC